MTRYSLFATLILSLLCFEAFAQDIIPRTLPMRAEDALRFGNTSGMLGTARFMGTGGSMTAIGVDHTTLHTNPAGIGWNRSSYASVSGGFSLKSIDTQLRSSFTNGVNGETATSVTLPSLGLIWAGGSRSLKWPTLNFGVSLTRMADYNETIAYEGLSGGSIIDAIVEDLNDGFFDDFRSNLIIDIDPSVGVGEIPSDQAFLDDRPVKLDEFGFYSDFDFEDNLNGQIDRSGLVERSGSMNELALGIGGNYDNKVMWGLGIGIPFLNFTETKTYSEVDRRDEIINFDDASFNESLEIEGTGANFKLGLIFLPSPESRVSVSMQTPTFWTFDEVYFTDLTYNYVFDGEALGGNALSPLIDAPFNLRTPWQFNAGAGYLIGKKGFLSADVNYMNFAGNEFSANDFTELEEAFNADVDATLKSSLNLRVGGEVNIDPIQVRAGVGYRTIPLIDARYGEDENQLTYSGGLGYNAGKFYIDVAARYTANSTYYAPYRTFAFDGQVVDTDRSRITGIITVGYRGL